MIGVRFQGLFFWDLPCKMEGLAEGRVWLEEGSGWRNGLAGGRAWLEEKPGWRKGLAEGKVWLEEGYG